MNHLLYYNSIEDIDLEKEYESPGIIKVFGQQPVYAGFGFDNTYQLEIVDGKVRVKGGGRPLTISECLRAIGYQTCEYVQSSGIQYVNTGITVSSDTWVKTDVVFNAAFDYNMAFGQWGSLAMSLRSGGMLAITVGNGESQNLTSCGVDVRHVYVLGPGYGLSIDGTRYPLGGVENTVTNYKMFVFGAGAAELSGDHPYSWTSYGRIRFYSLQIYQGITNDKNNSNTLRNYYPVYNISTGAIGLFDLVSNSFFGNNGTGTFTKGPDYEFTDPV